MAKIIVIEGTDGSGKETQSKKLENHYKELGYKVKRYSFQNNVINKIFIRKKNATKAKKD